MKSENGQTLVETALVIPIILLLLFGIVDFGRLFHSYITLNHAGREAARIASVGSDDAAIISVIESTTENLENEVRYTIPGSRTSGSELTLTLKYNFEFLTPVLGQLVRTFEIENKTVMRIE